ncbi:DUF6887 family protein [Aphanothece sacrum]|uniref:Uncharacterized protein n=1 Tax=Aphanothece sacrum FPU1 TaxID=1920663 RepID=A0A401IJ57_APHSA|nr:hypothetical protein [Aphanothece sacrum]GBF81342.1 hypothetical protein AsFPU1_2755 [Aphanothece sacrum FPU1]
MMSPQPNFKTMSLQELRSYVLTHRDDEKAWQEFANRRRPNAIYFEVDMSLLEQETKLNELLEKKLND